MPDEFDHSSEPRFSSFIPLAIALTAFIAWFLVQDYELNMQRSLLKQNIAKAQPTVAEAIQISQRYVALMKDLLKTAQTDEAAKAIVNDAVKAGLIRVQPAAPASAAAPATPAATGT
jgi:hypothetical protein